MTALKKPLAWDGAREHGRDRAGSSGPGPILEHGEDTQHVVIKCTYNVECVEVRRPGHISYVDETEIQDKKKGVRYAVEKDPLPTTMILAPHTSFAIGV